MGAKKKLLVAIVVGAILVLAFIAFRLKATTPITDITWEARVSKYLEIAWNDATESEEAQIYNIYWSNQPGINVRKPETYRRMIRTSSFQSGGRNFARIYAPYEWVYFVVAKDNFRSKEIEATTKPDDAFSCAHLNPQIVEMRSKSGQMTIKVDVLEDADCYILRQYLPDGTLRETEFDVKGLQSASLKFPVLPESVGYLALKKSAETSAFEFLFLSENLSPGADKWEMATRLC